MTHLFYKGILYQVLLLILSGVSGPPKSATGVATMWMLSIVGNLRK
jgi:hypothetical protein